VRTLIWFVLIAILSLQSALELYNKIGFLLIVIIILLIGALLIYNYYVIKYNIIGKLYLRLDHIKIELVNGFYQKIDLKNEVILYFYCGKVKGENNNFAGIFIGSNHSDGSNNRFIIKTKNWNKNLRVLIRDKKEQEIIITYLNTIKNNSDLMTKIKYKVF
jgi:hypothetical protein